MRPMEDRAGEKARGGTKHKLLTVPYCEGLFLVRK